MSQREDLLRGARQCIAEKGFARTTARDIAAASGANLASIGYYYGSKDALLNAAVVEALEEWGDGVEETVASLRDDPPQTRLESLLKNYIATLPERGGMMVSTLQAFAEANYSPDVRDQITQTYDKGRRDIAAFVLGVPREDATESDLALASLVLSIMNGYALQWLTAPETTPDAAELIAAIRRLTAAR